MTTELLFTAVPLDGVHADGRLRLSVLVSPRLRGGERLGDYPGSMLRWTRLVRDQGLRIRIDAGGRQSRYAVSTEFLQPDLWEALFTERVPVQAYRFDQDLVERAQQGVASYSMRESLSLIKAIYREASVALALPRRAMGRGDERGHRAILTRLIADLAVHSGGEERSRALRQRHLTRLDPGARLFGDGRAGSELARRLERIGRLRTAAQDRPLLDEEGCYDTDATRGLSGLDRQAIAESCMAFHSMPTPLYGPEEPASGETPGGSNLRYDPDRIIDLHQALSALGNYPSLQRALGLVFDLDLPAEAVEPTVGTGPSFLEVTGHSLDGDFVPSPGRVRTGYVLFDAGPQGLMFHTAPRPGTAGGGFGIAPFVAEAFGIAQIDVDGAMHKAVRLAESFNKPTAIGGQPALTGHPEAYDPSTVLPALRSGGLNLYADLRAATWLAGLQQTAAAHGAFEQGKVVDLFARDLIRGLRLDVWDDRSGLWHSLHERSATYRFFTADDQPAAAGFDPLQSGFDPELEEGWVESALTRPAPGTAPADDHYYLHEALARWNGWSLSAPRPDLALAADPSQRDPEPSKEVDPPASPFKIQVDHRVKPGSLPSLRFGRSYRLRGRWVNLAGLSPCLNDPSGDEACLNSPVGSLFSRFLALPNAGRDGFRYRRFEPIASPIVVVDDPEAFTGQGSTLHRLVIRTANDDPALDGTAAALWASARHLLPPRVSVEMAERIGMLDGADGRLLNDAATWALIAERDGSAPGATPMTGELPQVPIQVAGAEPSTIPLISEAFLADLPYLPDGHARGVALRDLPGTPSGCLARIDHQSPSGPVVFEPLNDPNPRPGSALLISFDALGDGNWRTLQGVRLMLAEPAIGPPARAPDWDGPTRTLTVYLAKGQRRVVPVSCYQLPADLPVMGIWQWFQEEVASLPPERLSPAPLSPGEPVDEIAHLLQRMVEGGHWMLTPPVLLELVHALRQPLGQPAFQPLAVGRGFQRSSANAGAPLQTALTTAPRLADRPTPAPARRDPDELAALTGWRRWASTEAFLLGALRVHGASTGRIDLLAEWTDPVDDPRQHPVATGTELETRRSAVDRIDLPLLEEGYLIAADARPAAIDDPVPSPSDRSLRHVGYYDPEHDQIVFVQPGDTSLPSESVLSFDRVAAPRHVIGDTRHHRIRYRAEAVSRDADCFPAQELDQPGFSRLSEVLEVSIPASSRPLAPEVAYVLPTFGWQRQTATALKRSVRFGGGLRIYLRRPWFSSGEGEWLGVALWRPSEPGQAIDQRERDRGKSLISQWGMDPLWQTETLRGAPTIEAFPDRHGEARNVALEERSDVRVDVVGYPVAFDADRQLWYADLTVDTGATYAPFVRLALVRFQPEALPEARISRVVLADFAQLTPGRAVVVHPHAARSHVLRVQVSGLAPRGPQAKVQRPGPVPPLTAPPTRFLLRVQERIEGVDPELGWQDISMPRIDLARLQNWGLGGTENDPVALYVADESGGAAGSLSLWEGFVCFRSFPAAGRYRFLIEEYEVISNDKPTDPLAPLAPGRLIFAEIIPIDGSLLPT